MKQAVRGLVVADGSPELVQAQFAVFSRQVPLMYAIMLISAWALTLNSVNSAPLWLSLYVPVLFSAVCILRVGVWWLARNERPTPAQARKALTRTNIFAAILAVVISGWAVTLSHHVDEIVKTNVAFFMSVTGVSVVICLLHLRTAAFIVAIAINVPFMLNFGLSGSPTLTVMAINMLLVSAALLVVVVVQSDQFAKAIDSRTKLEAANCENSRLANRDSLTGLNNRRRFFTRLHEACRAATPEGRSLAIGIVDLDGFKPVNDLYGHVVGDALLVDIGKRLKAVAGDTVSVSRLGGDEFALIFCDFEDTAALMREAERVAAALRDPVVLEEATVRMSATIGVATFPEMAGDALELYERADYALNVAKRTHRAHALMFSSEHAKQIEKTARLEHVLREADLASELTVVFQPIVDIRAGRTVAFEALSRWTSPILGDISPAQFIPVAERAGLISRLTRLQLEKALAVAVTWPQDIRLSFNLSTHDICSSEGLARIVGIIRKSEFPPERLDLELTETAMMFDFEQAKTAVETLRRLGCGIALDDFGTGYSSLTQLHALPLTEIKIDRRFVSMIEATPASYKIVKSLLALSRDMGLSCVIEGVETEAELEALSGLGGRLTQGFLHSAPMPQEEIDAFLSRTNLARVS